MLRKRFPHFWRIYVTNSIYALHPESFCAWNSANRKVLTFCVSALVLPGIPAWLRFPPARQLSPGLNYLASQQFISTGGLNANWKTCTLATIHNEQCRNYSQRNRGKKSISRKNTVCFCCVGTLARWDKYNLKQLRYSWKGSGGGHYEPILANLVNSKI